MPNNEMTIGEGAKSAASQIFNEARNTPLYGMSPADEENAGHMIQGAIDAELARSREEALEEAAKECEFLAQQLGNLHPFVEEHHRQWVTAYIKSAARIRALKKGGGE